MGLLRQSHNVMPQKSMFPVPASRGDLLLPSTSPPPADTPCRPSGSPREAGLGFNHLMGLLRQSHNMMPQKLMFPVPASRGDLLLPSTSPLPADTPCRPSGSPREAGTGIQPPNGTFETVSQHDASERDVPSPRFTRGPAPSLHEPPTSRYSVPPERVSARGGDWDSTTQWDF